MRVNWQRTSARVLENTPLGVDRYLLKARAPAMTQAIPGQFVYVLPASSLEPFLRRPFSVAMAEGEDFQVFYAVRGRGTEILASLKPGDFVDVMGPLGRGFPLDPGDNLLVAGGMGVAPLVYLAHRLLMEGATVSVIVGASKESGLVGVDLLPPGSKLLLATEDGSRGFHGTTVDLMLEEIDAVPHRTLSACGPIPMLETIRLKALERRLTCYISLEARMGCGIGACMGCVIPGREGYLRVCRDGPVFGVEEVGSLE